MHGSTGDREPRGAPAVPAARPQRDPSGGGHGRRHGHPHGGLLRRGHDHDGGRGRSPGPARRPGGHGPRGLVVRHHHARLRRQDERHRDPCRAAARRLGAGVRRQRVGPLGARGAAGGAGRNGAGALVAGPVGDDAGDLLAEVVGWGSATEEFLDRWRAPGDAHARRWEGRFGEGRYLALGQRAWDDALKDAGLVADQVDRVLVVGAHGRAVAGVAKALGVAAKVPEAVAGLDGAVGFTGAAHPALALAAALDTAAPGEVLALVVLADGADVVVWRTTDAVADRARRSTRPVAAQLAAGGPVPYGKALAWRGFLPVAPPNRPEPARPSAPAAARSSDWKFGFVGSQGADGTVHLPPVPTDDHARPMADATGTIVTFTVDRLAYSPSPPVVFAVVDFDGGGRLPVELTDVDAADVAIGGRVEMTFRRLFTADGIHNYFWKARPLRPAGEG